MIRAIVFDCFGVVLTDALQQLRDTVLQEDPAVAQQISDIIAANNRGYLQPSESNQQIADLLHISVAELRRVVSGREVRDKRLLAYIKRLRPTYKTAMLSNIAGSSLLRRFPDDELATYFDVVVASGDIGYAKPEHEAYKIVVERLGVRPEECVFTDDRELYCEAATALGMHGIVYENFPQFSTDLEMLLAQAA